MKKFEQLDIFFSTSLVFAILLASCVEPENNSAKNIPPITQEISPTPPRQKLVELIWRIANKEDSAIPEKVLPHFGIEKIPPLHIASKNKSEFSLSTTDASDEIQRRLNYFGLKTISYAHLKQIAGASDVNYFHINVDQQTTCITTEDVILVFGKNYERMPPAIVAPMPAEAGAPAANASPVRDHDIAGLEYENMFHGKGDVRFTFEFNRCAESLTIYGRDKT